jgi:hypothetical protein
MDDAEIPARYNLALWSVTFSALKGTDWDEAAIATFGPQHKDRAKVLCHVFAMMESEDGVLAALKAAWWYVGNTFLSEQDILRVAVGFTAYYDGFQTRLQEHLDENYGKFPAKWVAESALPELRVEMANSSEIWVEEDNLPGLWIFRRP